MDTFDMDKMSNKMTAEDLMRANMAADDEMDSLKDKVKEYNECLEQMQRLVEDSVTRLEKAQVDNSEINRLVEVAIDRINEVQRDTAYQINAEVQTVLENFKLGLSERPDELEELRSILSDMPGDSEELKILFSEKMDVSYEYVHKECVKVYRNVQAVVKEENAKIIDSVGSTLREYREKIKGLNNVTTAAMLLALGTFILQLLSLIGLF